MHLMLTILSRCFVASRITAVSVKERMIVFGLCAFRIRISRQIGSLPLEIKGEPVRVGKRCLSPTYSHWVGQGVECWHLAGVENMRQMRNGLGIRIRYCHGRNFMLVFRSDNRTSRNNYATNQGLILSPNLCAECVSSSCPCHKSSQMVQL